MKEQIINFETAKLAKEKGFDLNFLDRGFTNYYKPDGEKLKLTEYSGEFVKFCTLYCTQSLLQKWLREVHNMDCEVQNFIDKDGIKKYESFVFSDKYVEEYNSEEIGGEEDSVFLTYEEALEDSLYGALKDI